MQGLSMDDANEAAQEARSGNLRDNDAGIPDEQRPDYQDVDIPVVNGHPECAVGFDRIVDVSPFNTDDDFLSKRQNLEYAGPKNYGNQVVVTVENPQVIEGQVWEEEHDFRDLRVLGDPNSDYSPYSLDTEIIGDPTDPDGVETNGVNLGMGGFEGEQIDGFDTQYAQFFITARRASNVLGILDTAGNGSHSEDGEFTEGIVEYPPAMSEDGYDPENDGAPRAIGYPELRADMVDQQGAIAFRFGDNEPTQQSRVLIDFYQVVEGDDGLEMEGLAPLQPDDEAYALPTYPRGGNVHWDHGDGATERPEDVGADAEPSTSGGISEAQAVMDNDSTDELTYDDLGDEGQQFVDWALAAMEQMDDDYESVTEVDDWDEQHAKRTAGEPINATKDDLEQIIDERI